jgi:hypothetical protein
MLRERFGLYTDATCPPGRTVTFYRGDGIKVCRTNAQDTAPVAPTCATGTPYLIVTEGRETKAICVPSTTTMYPPDTTQSFPCRTGDYFGTSADTWTGHTCIPATTATGGATPPATGLDALTAQYTTLKAQYTTLTNQAIATPAQIPTLLPQIQSVNQQIASVLDQMVQATQYARQSPNSDTYRDQLIEQLAQIQSDYNGLKTNTDALETLRRIRGAQDDSWKGPLFLYLMAFLAAAILLTLVILFRGQKKESPTAPASSPAAIPALT